LWIQKFIHIILLYLVHALNRYPMELYLTILSLTHKHISSWTLSSYPCLHTHFQIKCHPIILTFTHKHIHNRTLSFYYWFNMQNTYTEECYLTILTFTHTHTHTHTRTHTHSLSLPPSPPLSLSLSLWTLSQILQVWSLNVNLIALVCWES
jgi:hypothetical protein